MARYLISYWGADPTTPYSNIESFKNDYLCGNNGNLLFKNAVTKSLASPENELSYFHMFDQKNKDITQAFAHNDIDYINNHFDAVILSEADLFNTSYIPRFPYFIDFLEQINIPIVMVGVGAASTLQKEILFGSPLDQFAKRIADLLLKHSASIGVRGYFTKQYLLKLGCSPLQVDVIGCPSMFTNGANLNIDTKKFDKHSFDECLVAFNGEFTLPIFQEYTEQHSNYLFFPQNFLELFTAMFEDTSDKSICYNPLYAPWVNQEKIRYYTNIQQWQSKLSEAIFSFGTRVHGNFLALLAGTPAYIVATDARTEELAQYFEIPYHYLNAPHKSLYELYAEADYSRLLSGHAQRFERYKNFLEKNNLNHALNLLPSTSPDLRKEAEGYPDYILPIQQAPKEKLAERLSFLKENYIRQQGGSHLPPVAAKRLENSIASIAQALGNNNE